MRSTTVGDGGDQIGPATFVGKFLNSQVGDTVPSILPGFEKELPKPFPESFELIGRHADDIAALLRAQYPASSGYVVAVDKETNPRLQSWEVKLHRGLFAGARVMIHPSPKMPGRALVDVSWHSRLFDMLPKVLGSANGVVMILAFIIFKIFTRGMIFALISTLVVGAISLLISLLASLLFVKKCWDWFGKEFDKQRLATLAEEIKSIPLPSRSK